MSSETSENAKYGRKVFLLYPHSVVSDALLEVLLKNGYEVYVLDDHKKTHKILKVFNDSILFINIDGKLSERRWGKYIKRIMKDPATKDVRIGVMSYNANRTMINRYLFDPGLPCGFIVLKGEIGKSTDIVLKTLAANEAKGRRRFLRVENPNQAFVNVLIDNSIFVGRIEQISMAGMACYFQDELPVEEGDHLEDVQLLLRGIMRRVPGTVEKMYTRNQIVVQFNIEMEQPTEDAIRDFIHYSLQQEIKKIADG